MQLDIIFLSSVNRGKINIKSMYRTRSYQQSRNFNVRFQEAAEL